MTSTTTPTSSQPSQIQSAHQDSKDDTKSEMSAIPENVRRLSFYHGLMPRQDIEPLLLKDGDFLLRKTDRDKTMILALAVRWSGPVKHFIVNQDKDSYYFESHKVCLLSYYNTT